MPSVKTWEFWSIIVFFVPPLIVGTLSARIAFKKGHREAYYLVGLCLILCAAVYANKILDLRLTGPVGLERDRAVLEAKTETIQARDEVEKMKFEVEQAQASVTKVANDLQKLNDSMYVADNIILHGMRYPLSEVFQAAAYREMKNLQGSLGEPPQKLRERVDRVIQKTEEEHKRFWSEYEKLPDEKTKEKFLNDYMRRAQE